MDYHKYLFRHTSLHEIRNRNEVRVINFLEEILSEFDTYEPNEIDIQDIYALALNKLPAHYSQKETIIFTHEPEDDDVKKAIRDAVAVVRKHPRL